MPVIPSTFRPHWILANGHVQTLLGAWVRKQSILYHRERLELSDGDFLDLDWKRQGHRRLVIFSHGLEGSSTSSYIAGLAKEVNAHGWDALAWNMRGCSVEVNRLPRRYHSGESGDLRTVVNHAAVDYDAVALVGFSLGGNVSLKYLGEQPAHPKIVCAVGISVPVDLRASADALDRQWQNRLYLRNFLGPMVAKMERKAQLFPDQVASPKRFNIRSLRQFDDLYTAPLHGFEDAEDYWRKSSSKPYLARIDVPTLLINARNDSFLTSHSLPFDEARTSPHLILEAPASGGHVGFLTSPTAVPWYLKRVPEFIDSLNG